jgi:X-Pro dipeptidyl-peptidase
VEIVRDDAFDSQKHPVLLTYSPYNTLSEPEPARDAVARRYVPRGYARAVADLLGTRGSTGCWDYGGVAETLSGRDVVKYLAGRSWSNGNVAMLGTSYNGTTANMVAALGDEVPELKAIIPTAAISRWYGYAYSAGVRYFLNSESAADEGFDTPLLFDVGFSDTFAADPERPADILAAIAAHANECGAVEHTQHGYDRSPDYTQFWLDRDYRRRGANFRAAMLLVHGWQDYNVKQEEGTSLWQAVPEDDPATAAVEGVPFKRMIMSQGRHTGIPAQFNTLVDAFLDRTLKGIPNGVENGPEVLTLGRRFAGAETTYREEASYPAPGTRTTTLWLTHNEDPLLSQTGAGALSAKPAHVRITADYLESGTSTEESWRNVPLQARPDGLLYLSPPLAADTRISGSAVLDVLASTSVGGTHVQPVLLEVTPTGATRTVERGFLNLDYRNGLERAEPATGWQRGEVTFLPQDYTFTKGNRVALVVQSSNTVWALPGNAGRVEIAHGHDIGGDDKPPIGTRLQLPVVGGPAEAAALFVK